MKVLPVRQAAKRRPRPELTVVSWGVALFSLPIGSSEDAVPPPASATTPFRPAPMARPPEPGTVPHPCAAATRLLALTHPSRVSFDCAEAVGGAATTPSRS